MSPAKSARAPKATASKAPAGAKPAKESAQSAQHEAARRGRSELANKVVHLIAEEMAIEEAELTANASFKEDLNLDEIDVAELFMQAEATLHTTPFNEEDWEGCETVGDFIALVESHAPSRKSHAAKRP